MLPRPLQRRFLLSKSPSSAQDGDFGFWKSCWTVVYLRELKEQYQHTILGWTVPLDHVKERCIQDMYSDRADQMWRLMVITDVAHHLDALTELAGRYVAWSRGRGESE